MTSYMTEEEYHRFAVFFFIGMFFIEGLMHINFFGMSPTLTFEFELSWRSLFYQLVVVSGSAWASLMITFGTS